MRRTAVVAVAILAGCGGEQAGKAQRGLRGSPSGPSAPAPAPVRGRPVTFRATDGRPVRGELTTASGRAPALVLVHQSDGGQDQWDPLVPYLHRAGFTTLAYDGRGGIDEEDLSREVVGALRFLRTRDDVDRRRLGVVGASVGASTAAFVLAEPAGRRVRAAVALSPPDAGVVFDLQGKHRWHPHDVLFVSDRREASSVANAYPGPVRSRRLVTRGYGHGVALLPDPAVRQAVLAWLEARVRG